MTTLKDINKLNGRIRRHESDVRLLEGKVLLECSPKVKARFSEILKDIKRELKIMKEEKRLLESNFIPLQIKEIKDEMKSIEKIAKIYGKRGSTNYNACLHYHGYYELKIQLSNLEKQGGENA